MKILHASDFHLDSPLGHLSREQALIRRKELREIPAALAELARREQADLVLLPGDLFDGQRVCPETVDALTAALGSLDLPVVIAPGNHDCLSPSSPYRTARWPDNVHIFPDREMGCFTFPRLNCAVHGCAFTDSHRADSPLAGFTAPEDGLTHLLCIHGEVAAESVYAPLPPAALAHSGVVYAALGHIHSGSGLCREGNTAWAYCGCPEGRGFDECGEKGALVIELTDGGISARFCPLSRRQYRVERVDLSQFDAFLPTDAVDDLVRVILTGESAHAPDLAALETRLRRRFFYAELRDETTLPQSLWARAEEDSLTGLFLRGMLRRLSDAAEEDKPRLLLAARFGLAALEGGEDICP
ncbi:MAG: DNA repair exonuclease [Oscillospiraceae bacterium]|nr:DNA repair exonuclease [Oscillospiraceae bacterium]